MKYYLGIDNGGTVTKAALYTKSGEEYAVESVETHVFSNHPGFTERDMIEMREANFKVIRILLEKTEIDIRDIVGLACCGHGKGLYLWGKDNKPVRAGIISTDNRAWEYPERWKQDGVSAKVFEKTYQEILSCQPVSLLAWLKDHEPETIAKIKWIFECKDYVRFCLTGEAYGELTDYSGANLVNLKTRQYDRELLDLFGIGDVYDCLPPLCTSTDICGYVNKEASERTGLLEGTPVMGGMFDIDACAVAVDVTAEDKVCMIAGTWSINEYISKTPITDGSVAMNSIFCIPDYYLIEESSPTSAANFEWFVRTLMPELKMQMKNEGESVYALADEWVRKISAAEFCPLFLPFLMAGNVHPNAKASFIGITNYHTRSHLIKSVYEGVAFSHRYHLEKLLDSREELFSVIRLAGGVTNSKELIQIFADVLKYPIEIVEINETGTLGCAMTIAVALSDYSSFSEAVKNMIHIRKAVQPHQDNTELYDMKYKLYKSVIDALDPVWNRIQSYVDHNKLEA